MTDDKEERMLRVTKEQWNEYLTEETRGLIQIAVDRNIDWSDLEPAPSKDWRPHCFGPLINESCIGFKESFDGETMDTDPSCQKCPWLKRGISLREAGAPHIGPKERADPEEGTRGLGDGPDGEWEA